MGLTECQFCFTGNVSVKYDDAIEGYVEEATDIGDDENFINEQLKNDTKIKKPCKFGAECTNIDCLYQHPSGWEVCRSGKDCVNCECHSLHPYGRKMVCPSGMRCWNVDCESIHPFGWVACGEGVSCCLMECSCVHPPGRAIACGLGGNCKNSNCENLHPNGWDPSPDSPCDPQSFKSPQERISDQQLSPLPIFAEKDTICRRLEREKVLVVTAATGSGK
jgi:hypothetical protein